VPFDIKSPRPWGYILLELSELAVGGPWIEKCNMKCDLLEFLLNFSFWR